MSHLICSVCSGHHHPENCPTAQRFLNECRQPVVGDFQRPERTLVAESNIIDLSKHRAEAAERSLKRAERHRKRSWPMSVVT